MPRRKRTAPEFHRVTQLLDYETCPRRHVLSGEVNDNLPMGNVGTTAVLGTAMHEVCEEMLRTLHRQGEQQMPTTEAIEVMHTVMAKVGIVLNAEDRDTLRVLVLNFAQYRWPSTRLMSVERRLTSAIDCPDGKPRVLTGQPDAVFSDPPRGVVIVDFKSGWAPPRSPRKLPDAGPDGVVRLEGMQYLSERAHMQLDGYGYLALQEYPAAEYVLLVEVWPRIMQTRKARLDRSALEHIERELGTLMMHREQAILGGRRSPLSEPRPGRQCLRQCPVVKGCTIPADRRGIGSLANTDLATAAAKRYVVVDALRQELRNELKAYHEETGQYLEVGDRAGSVLGWEVKPEGGRSFGLHVPQDDNGEASALGGEQRP